MYFSFILRICSKEKMKEAFFSFIKIVPVSMLVKEFWQKNSIKMQHWYLSQKKRTDVIISASPEFLLKPFLCNTLGIRLIASKINVSSGKYTGKNCHGEEKARQFKSVFGNEIIDNFYSDSRYDVPMANIAKRAFFVKRNHISEWSIK
jgi:phosphoserine phosphatase